MPRVYSLLDARYEVVKLIALSNAQISHVPAQLILMKSDLHQTFLQDRHNC